MMRKHSFQRAEGEAPVPEGSGHRARLIASLLLALVIALFATAAGCAGASGEETPGQFPTYAYNSAVTLEGYKVATRIPEVLSAMPCYCGCGPSQGHTSLQECFFAPDGSFTDHASNCHLCVEEAIAVSQWVDQGLDLKTIRAQLEETYSEYGPSTDTPPL